MTSISNKTKPFNLKECKELHGGQCITAEGDSARIVYENVVRSDGYHLVVLTVDGRGDECTSLYNEQGLCVSGEPSRTLLLPVKVHRIPDGWRNIYIREDGSVYAGAYKFPTEKEAKLAVLAGDDKYLKTVQAFIEVEV